MNIIPRIFITPGEPAGIGPEIVAQAAQQAWEAELIAVCDPVLLESRAKNIDLPLDIRLFDFDSPPILHKPGTIACLPVRLKDACIPGKLNSNNARYVIECLEIAANSVSTQDSAQINKLTYDTTQSCSSIINSKKIPSALVTGPIHKSIINDAGIAFTGHTEFLAEMFRVKKPIMLFVTNQLRVALVTTHIPLSQVSHAITQELLIETIEILHSELQNKFHIPHPHITLCGLNPHAGEAGHLGREEIDVIQPALHYLRQANKNIIGPLPADTIFTEKFLKKTDVVVAMYHDQALPVVKYMSFGHAVNVTLGLPIVRTSVDHGTALDIAATKQADANSLFAAISLAKNLLSAPNSPT